MDTKRGPDPQSAESEGVLDGMPSPQSPESPGLNPAHIAKTAESYLPPQPKPLSQAAFDQGRGEEPSDDREAPAKPLAPPASPQEIAKSMAKIKSSLAETQENQAKAAQEARRLSDEAYQRKVDSARKALEDLNSSSE